jgi:hypothetical protein
VTIPGEGRATALTVSLRAEMRRLQIRISDYVIATLSLGLDSVELSRPKSRMEELTRWIGRGTMRIRDHNESELTGTGGVTTKFGTGR